MATGSATRVVPLGVQNCANNVCRIGVRGKMSVIDERGAFIRSVKTEHAAHRGGFSCTIRSQEASDCAIWSSETQVRYGSGTPITFGQVFNCEHT